MIKNNKSSLPDSTAGLIDELLNNQFTSSSTPSAEIEKTADNLLEKDSSRKKINSYIDEYVVTEEFINKIRRYSRQEFDSMLLKVFIWITGISVGTVITILLTGKIFR